jgi:hypothetical protein
MGACGTIFPNHMGSPPDPHGCVEPAGHQGPHVFVGDNGRRIAWENDWECACDDCHSDDSNDWCVTYWNAALTAPQEPQSNG